MKTFRDIFPAGDGDAKITRLGNIRTFQRITAQLTGEELDPERIGEEDEGEAKFYVGTAIEGARLGSTYYCGDGEGNDRQVMFESTFGTLSPIYSAFVRAITGARSGRMTSLATVTDESARGVIGRLVAAAHLVLGTEPCRQVRLPKLAPLTTPIA